MQNNLQIKLVTSLRITEENLKDLHKIRGELEAKRGTFTTMDHTLSEIIQVYKKKRK